MEGYKKFEDKVTGRYIKIKDVCEEKKEDSKDTESGDCGDSKDSGEKQ